MASLRDAAEASRAISDERWADYARDGYLHLGEVIGPDELIRLRNRADDLALGRVHNDSIELQRDTGGRYEDLPEAEALADQQTLLYRKIQGLQTDDLYSPVLRHPIFAEVAAHHYGLHSPVSLFRAMVMNKPARQGTVLPWHQDGGDVWALDRDPLVTIWIALDGATSANGCVEAIPGSHRLGLLSLTGSTVTEEDVRRHCPEDQVHPLEVPAGHAVLMHNWLIHRSGINPTDTPRRAFTACYMDGRTVNVLTGDTFPLVFGTVPDTPYPFLAALTGERDHYRMTAATAEEYALSLLADNQAKAATIEATATHAAARGNREQLVTAVAPIAKQASRTAQNLAGRLRNRTSR